MRKESPCAHLSIPNRIIKKSSKHRMATLEKIRSKSVLLLIIVGAALLAFVIGDFFTSGRTLFGTGTTIAEVGK